MKKLRFFYPILATGLLLIALGAPACKDSPNGSDHPPAGNALTEAPAAATPSYGMVIGEHINVRTGPSLDSVRIFQVNHEEILVIEEEGKERVPVGNSTDLCDAYPWVKIRNGSGQSGWMYGQYLFKILEHSPLIADSVVGSFVLGGKTHTLALCHDYGVGAANDEGLTGCPDFFPVIVHSGGWHEAHLLELRSGPHSTYPYWNLIDDDGTHEAIAAIQNSPDGEVKVRIAYSYQDGGSEYFMRIFREDGKWVAEAL